MIQPYQNSSQKQVISSSYQPSRQTNQIQSYQGGINNQLAINPFGNDPFFSDFNQVHSRMMQNMTQIMMNGSLFEGNSMFPSSMISTNFNENDIYGFSNLNNQVMRGGNGNGNGGNGQFQMYSRSMVQQQVIGPDGKPKLEKYYNDNMIQRGDDGNTISEKKQAYHNQGSGRSILAHERMLNDQGHKYIKERNHLGQIEDQNLYHNIQEEEAQQFHDRWNQQRNVMKSLAPSQPTRYMQIQHQPNNRGQLGYYDQQQQERPQLTSSQQQQYQRVQDQQSIQQSLPQQRQIVTPMLSQSSNSRPLSGYSSKSQNIPSRFPETQTQPIRISTPNVNTYSQNQYPVRVGSSSSSSQYHTPIINNSTQRQYPIRGTSSYDQSIQYPQQRYYQ